MKNIKTYLEFSKKYRRTEEMFLKNLEIFLENFRKFRKINTYFVLN